MKKYFRVLISLLLVMALSLSHLYVGVRAEDNANGQGDIKKVKITGINTINKASDGLVEMYFATDTTFSTAADVPLPSSNKYIKVDYSGKRLHSIKTTANSNQLLLRTFEGTWSNGKVVKIPVGVQFQVGDVTYEFAESYGFTYNGSTGGTKIDPIPLSFVGVDDNNTKNNTLALTTSVNFEEEYGWASGETKKFTKDTSPDINGTAASGIPVYYFASNRVMYENAFESIPEPQSFKIAKGTWFNCDGKMFETTDDYVLQYDSSSAKWNQVFEEKSVTLTTEVTTLDNRLIIPTGLEATSISDYANVIFTTNTILVNGDATKVTEVTISEDGKMVVNYAANAGDVLSISGGSVYTNIIKSKKLNVTNTTDLVLRYNGSEWKENVGDNTNKVTITGIELINKASGGLVEMYLKTDTTWNVSGEYKFQSSNKLLKTDYTSRDLYSVKTTANSTRLTVLHWNGSNMNNGTVVKIPYGTQFEIGGKTYKLAESYGFTYDGSTGGTKITTVPISFTGIDETNTKNNNISLTTNINFKQTYNWPEWNLSYDLRIVKDTSPEVNGTSKSGTVVYFLDSNKWLYEDAMKDVTSPQSFKLAKGTWFVRGGIIFEATDDFEMQYNSVTSKWKQVFTDKDLMLTTDVKTTDTGLAIPTGLDVMTVSDFANVSFSTDSIFVNGDGTKVSSVKISQEGQLVIDYIATAGDVLKIDAGSVFTNSIKSKRLNVTNSDNLVLRYDGSKWVESVEIKVKEDVSISDVFYSTNENVFLRTDLPAEHVFTGKYFTTSDILVKKMDGTTTNISNFKIHLDSASQNNTISFAYQANEGDVITIVKGGSALNLEEGYELHFDNIYTIKYDGNSWGAYEEKVTPESILVQSGAELYIKTDMLNTHEFVGKNFVTSSIKVTGSDGTTKNISKFKMHASDGRGNIYLTHTPNKGDILSIQKDGKAVDETTGYTIKFRSGYALQYNGSKWVSYVETVTINGIENQANNVVYLKTNLGKSHTLYADNKGYSSSDITITKCDGTAGTINWITVDNNTGAISVGYTPETADVLFVKSGGTAKNATYGYSMKFADGYVLKYDGTKWVENFVEITLGDILAQDDTSLYITTGLGKEHELYAENGKYSSSAISVMKKDGTVRQVDVRIDKNSGALYLASYTEFEEGDVCRIQMNGTATNATKKLGMRFVDKMTLYYENGDWHIDSEGPEFYYQGKLVTGSTLVAVSAGRNKSSLEECFSAKDAIKGVVQLTFSYSNGALNNEVFCAGEWEITLTAEDGHGNQSVRIVSLNVRENALVGDSDFDDELTVTDLVRIKKAIKNTSTELSTYDMNGDGYVNAEDAKSMRCVLIGKYSIIDNQLVLLPSYSGSAVLFADYPPKQTSNASVQEYFDAGFTHMLMTEDYTALSYNNQTPYNSYATAITRIKKYGDVIVRNQIDHPDYFQNDAEKTVEGYKIPVRNLTDEFAKMGVQSFYYSDEPSVSEFESMQKLITWHNTYNKGAMFHVNLLPSYANNDEIGGSFQQYIQSYVNNVLAKVEGKKTLSIDNYPLVKENIFSTSLRSSYLSDLLTVAHAVKNYNAENPVYPAEVSFCIQSFGDKLGIFDEGLRTINSANDIRFQANMAIALGAHNLEYYLYKGANGMVEDNVKTDVYEYVKSVNQEVQAWDHVFTSFHWQGTLMCGTGYNQSDIYSEAQNKFVSKFNKVTTSATMATVVSEFVDDYGNYAYMAVNATEPSESSNGSVTFAIEGAKKAVVYKNGNASIETLSSDELTVPLKTGDAVFCIPIY